MYTPQPERDSLFTLCTVLHTFGVGSSEAEAFKTKFTADEGFQRRARVLERLLAPGAGEQGFADDDTLPPIC